MRKSERRRLAEADYVDGMELRSIAQKYNVCLGTVRAWKRKYRWSRKGIQQDETSTVAQRVLKEKKKAIEAVAKIDEITEKQRLFVLHYLQTHNATSSYQRAYGCNWQAAMTSGCRLLRNSKIQAAIKELRNSIDATLLLSAKDIVDLYTRIAFVDYNAFYEYKDGKMVAKPLNEVDTQVLASANTTKHGIEYHFVDRTKALQWLSDYFELNPNDRHRAEYQKKMTELREREVKAKEEGW